REKDNPDALNWDEIPKANYTTWNPGYSFNSVISAVNNEINQSPRFKGIRDDVTLLDKYNDKETPLNIVKYRQKLSEIKATSKNLEDLTKLPVDLSVSSIARDSIDITGDKDKIAKNKQFLKRLSSDIYVDETVKVIDKIIGEAALAQVNKKPQ
ncbi:MAG: carboxy terminal-processing peptidase, partial [Bacteroidota bacterium]|nr:carboxy terminal-processing peptidase [Bacteroidota bacterium]